MINGLQDDENMAYKSICCPFSFDTTAPVYYNVYQRGKVCQQKRPICIRESKHEPENSFSGICATVFRHFNVLILNGFNYIGHV